MWICFRNGKYTDCGRMRALFSTEIVEAGAVKGLRKPLRTRSCASFTLEQVRIKFHMLHLPLLCFRVSIIFPTCLLYPQQKPSTLHYTK